MTSTTALTQGADYFIVRRESGSERADLPVWRARPGTVVIDPNPRECRRHDVDTQVDTNPSHLRTLMLLSLLARVLPQHGIFVLHNVLSMEECQQIIDLSSAMGYTEDAPVSLARDIRHNSNNVWVADEASLNAPIFERAKALLPQKIVLNPGDGSAIELGPPAGLNARWRLYRYDPEDEFKQHTDGAWPPSGLDAEGNLVDDLSRGNQLSWLTFLIYLTDDFEGGGT